MRSHATIDDPDPGPAARSLASGKSSHEREEVASRRFVDVVEIGLQTRGNGAQAPKGLARGQIARHRQGHASDAKRRIAVVGDDREARSRRQLERRLVGIDRDEHPSADRLPVPVVVELTRMLAHQFS